jgi:hypothetical protein
MPASLVQSQFATLEPLGDDENGLTLDLDQPIDGIVDAYLAAVATLTVVTTLDPATTSLLVLAIGAGWA